MSAPSASRQLLLSTLLLSLTPPVTANGGYDDLLYFLLGLLVVCAVLVGLGGYAAVGLLRFVCMQPPVTLRQAMQGRQGGACACCPCHSFELARETAEQAQADRAFVTTLVTAFVVALFLMFVGMAVCGGHFYDGYSWDSSYLGALLQVMCAVTMFIVTCIILFAGCGCALCAPRPVAAGPIVAIGTIEMDPGAALMA
jgi:hypothetical protein